METVFDVAGRATTVRRVGSTGTVVWSMTQGWDAAGNRVSVTSSRGNVPNAVAAQFTTSFGYDAVNRLVSVTEPVTGSTTRSTGYGYDLAGNTTRVIDGRGNVSWYGFNEWGVQTTVTEPSTTAHPNLSDRQWVTSLDAGGLPVRTVEPGGVSVTRVFDELGRLVSETGSGAGVVSASRTFGYDAAGLRTSAGTAGGNIVFGYDDRGLLTSVTGPAGFAGSSFTYDAAGRMLSRTDAAGTTQFTWNSRNLPATMRDGLTAQTATFTWDAAAQLTGVDYSGGGRRRFVYDQAGRVTSDQLSTSTATVTAGYSYEWDADSNLTARTVTLPGNTGAGVNRYGYDNAGRLTSWTRPNNSTLTYTWDAAGNLTANAGVAQTFDQRNRMLTSGSTTYTWSARGTLRSQKAGTAVAVPVVFDGLGRQTGFGSQTSVYDSLDRVVTHAGTGFSYAGFELDPVKIGNTLLARGPAGGLLAVRNGTATAVLAGLDQHGDVGFWTSGAGTVSGTRTYTPFGAPVASTGTWAAPVGFQGDYTDTTSSLTWMGARWYRPGTATFTARDTVFGTLDTPISLNRYTYAWADPLGRWDPDGRWSEGLFDGADCAALADKLGDAIRKRAFEDCVIAQDGLGQSYARNARKVEAQAAVVGRAVIVAGSMVPVVGDAMDVVGCVRRDYWSCASLVPYADVLTKSKRVAELARSADRVLDASRAVASAVKIEDRAVDAADTVRRVADSAATPLRRVDTPTPASISQPVTTYTPALNPTTSHRLHTTTDPPNLNNLPTATKSGSTLVYRGGSRTPDNLTPRPGIDDTGLSTYDTPGAAAPNGGKVQVIDTSRLKCTIACPDAPPPGHVSIRPPDAAEIPGWAGTRGTGQVSPFTQDIMDAVIDEIRLPRS
jgi:RHS repeat-associated protein